MSKIFCLAHYSYDEQNSHYFVGPDNVSKNEFEELCYNLVDSAGMNAIIIEKKRDYPCTIGWREVVEAMVPLLEKQGYHHFIPIEASFSGSVINNADLNRQNYDDEKLSSHVFTSILNFNKELVKEIK